MRLQGLAGQTRPPYPHEYDLDLTGATIAKPTTIRRSLITSFAVVIVLLTTGLLVLTIFGARQRAEVQSRQLLDRSKRETESRLTSFFRPVQVLLKSGVAWEPGVVEDEGKAFVASVANAIANLPQIAAVRVKPLGPWTLADFETQSIRWSRPKKIEASGELGMTAVTPVVGSDGSVRLIAVDIFLESISEFTRTYKITEHAIVVALVPSLPPSQQKPGEIPEAVVIGLPNDTRFEDPAARQAAYLLRGRDLDVGVWNDALGPLFARGGTLRDEPLRFESGGDTWWGAFWQYSLDPDLPIHTAILIPEHDLLGDHRQLQLYLALGATLAFVLALFFANRLSSRAGRPIEALVQQTERIRQGDFSPGAPIPSRLLEVQRLTEAHEEMRVGLQSLMRIEHELRVARDIQQGTFPTEMPRIEGYQLFGSSIPAEDTGGDTFAVIQTDESFGGKAVLMLADATGHGIGPALSVAHLHAMLRMAVRSDIGLAELVRHANAQLQEDLPDGRFISAWFGVLDASQHELQCYSCGQGPVFHYHALDDRFEEIESQSPPLGIFAFDVELPPSTALLPGDMYVVLSDGFHEAAGPDKELFEEQRVQDVIRTNADQRPETIVTALHRAVDEFTNHSPPDDDRTCLIVKRVGG